MTGIRNRIKRRKNENIKSRTPAARNITSGRMGKLEIQKMKERTGVQNGRLNAGDRNSKAIFIPELSVFTVFPVFSVLPKLKSE
jgi:hypothetical protein